MVSATEQRRFAGVVVLVLLLDMATKLAAETWLPRYMGVSIIGEFFQLRLVYNPGAAFGIHVAEHSRWVFMTLSTAALFILASMLKTTMPGDKVRLYSLALIFAGAAGNLIDRVRSARGVVDFLDVGIGALRWPTFNVADIAVSCGAIALVISMWREDTQRPQPESASAA
jgi:signal peptidase II